MLDLEQVLLQPSKLEANIDIWRDLLIHVFPKLSTDDQDEAKRQIELHLKKYKKPVKEEEREENKEDKQEGNKVDIDSDDGMDD